MTFFLNKSKCSTKTLRALSRAEVSAISGGDKASDTLSCVSRCGNETTRAGTLACLEKCSSK
ncbi:hypothetical protein [Methylobacterium sp. JK268]